MIVVWLGVLYGEVKIRPLQLSRILYLSTRLQGQESIIA